MIDDAGTVWAGDLPLVSYQYMLRNFLFVLSFFAAKFRSGSLKRTTFAANLVYVPFHQANLVKIRWKYIFGSLKFTLVRSHSDETISCHEYNQVLTSLM